MELHALVDLINAELESRHFQDYCPNGLQVEGRSAVRKLLTGVTACEALIDEAIAWQADAVLVHHGYFWKNESPRVVGAKKRRLQKLLQHDISLLAWHLPLDAHPELGNNAELARQLGLSVTGPLDPDERHPIGCIGRVQTPLTAAALGEKLHQILGREPLIIDGGDHPIETLGWCTGAAQGFISKAVVAGVDAFISGEISESTVHCAREEGIHYFAAGHHATERGGVMALGRWLEASQGLQCRFVDIPNPV
ncbi:MAG: Nif3-like dinuclear metal center hexameric protein [Kistimonas sp.]|nr:Nif3-like dinuclear metal center hexameric protein [Kistimonas sp.]